MSTYKIIRFYQLQTWLLHQEGLHKDRYSNRETLKRGLTLEEAQAHCSDPETSSRTCTLPVNVDRTRKLGWWFDGYEEEA